jgi:ketosteroid isomerase-like protein
MAVLSSNNSLPKEAKESLRQSIQYTILGSGIASSGDLGYVYGATVINGKTDNYLRIWRMENGDWRIVVEVLRY